MDNFFLALLSTINCDGFGVIGGKTVPSEKIASRRFSMRYVGWLLVVYGAKHDIRSKGLRIDEEDWTRVGGHFAATLGSFNVPTKEKSEVLGFIESLKSGFAEGTWWHGDRPVSNFFSTLMMCKYEGPT